MKAMRLILSLITLLTGVGCVGNGTALTKAKPAAPPTEQAMIPTESDVELTGSYLKQSVRRNRRITDGPSELIILDRETIERSGAADLNGLLIQQGLKH